MMLHAIKAIAFSTLLCAGSAYAADSDAPGFWTTPTIPGYGPMHDLPQSAYRPVAGITYRIVFALTKAPKSAGEVNPSLDRVARTVNLYVVNNYRRLRNAGVGFGIPTSLEEITRVRLRSSQPSEELFDYIHVSL